jgi:hypothetical protein
MKEVVDHRCLSCHDTPCFRRRPFALVKKKGEVMKEKELKRVVLSGLIKKGVQ